MYNAQSYQYRFADAVTLLCGGQVPPIEMVTAWLDRSKDDIRLQEFAMVHGPVWAQGIALLDAAHVIANSPYEDLPEAEIVETPRLRLGETVSAWLSEVVASPYKYSPYFLTPGFYQDCEHATKRLTDTEGHVAYAILETPDKADNGAPLIVGRMPVGIKRFVRNDDGTSIVVVDYREGGRGNKDYIKPVPLDAKGIELVAQWLEKQRTVIPATGQEFASALRFVGADGVLKETP